MGRTWKYIDRSRTHECAWNWDWGRPIHFLGIFKFKFLCSVVIKKLPGTTVNESMELHGEWHRVQQRTVVSRNGGGDPSFSNAKLFGRRCAGLYLQLSYAKPMQDDSALSGRQVIYKNNGGTSTGIRPQFSLWKGQQITRTEAYRQTLSPNCANNIIRQLMFSFTGRNRFISMESLWRHFKNWKTTRDAYLCLHLSAYIKIAQSIWWPSPFKISGWAIGLQNTCNYLHIIYYYYIYKNRSCFGRVSLVSEM